MNAKRHGHWHWLMLPGQVPLPLDDARIYIAGRADTADIRLDGERISREHCRFAWDGTHWTVQDLGSRNGTLVAGRPAAAACRLADGSEIDIGGQRLTYLERSYPDLPQQRPKNPPAGEQTVSVDDGAVGAAELVQRRLLGAPPEVPGHGIGLVYRGLEQVSGDFYDVALMPDGRLHLLLGDVSGHGVEAALIAATAVKTARLLRPMARSPEALLATLNRELRGDLPDGYFVTAWCAELDLASGRLRCAQAGHHPAAVLHAGPDGHLRRIGGSGAAIGLLPDHIFAATLIPTDERLEAGDLLVQTSDAVLEATSPDGTTYSLSRLEADLRLAGGTAQQRAEALAAAVASWSGAAQDDLTILLVARETARAGAAASTDGGPGSGRSVSTWLAPDSDAMRREADGLTARLPRRSLALHDAADYQPRAVIGRGGSGTVVAAEQPALGRLVAIKQPVSEDGRPVRRAAFLTEALVIAALEHPHILPVHELALDLDGLPLLAMRKAEGKAWRDAMADLDAERNLDILAAVADAVAFAHARGIVHRDLKPANVLLGAHGQIYLADWGSAAACGDPPANLRGLLRGPRPGQVVGTPAYMAPEMARGQASLIGRASDVYLLGGLLAEILCGRPPHQGASVDECLAAAAANRLPELSGDDPLADLARNALDADPAKRPPDGSAFRAALDASRRHRQGRMATMQAEGALAAARASTTTLDYLRAITAFEQALRLWRDDPRAQRGLSHARLALAEHAIARRDLNLATEQLDASDPEHRAAIDALAAAREQANSEAATLIRLRELERGTGRTWTTVHELGSESAAAWEARGSWARDAAGIVTLSGHEAAIARLAMPVTGDLRIELRAELIGNSPSDISLFFAAERGDDLQRSLETGYQVKIGAYRNTLDLIIRAGRRLATRTGPSLVPHAIHELRVECVGSTIAVHLDGRPHMLAEDPRPLGGPTRSAVGLLTWSSNLRVHSLRILQLGRPQVEDLLLSAERHLRAGHHATAADLFEDVLGAEPPAPRRERAELGLASARRLASLAARIPALAAAMGWPESALTVGSDGLEVHGPAGVADLAPLTGVPVSSVELPPGSVADLAPLAGAPLRTLSMSRHRIADLSPLCRAPLTNLQLNENRVSDLSPLAGMPIERLALEGNAVSDLTPLADAPLVFCALSGNRVSDIAPVCRPRLGTLHLARCPVRDLAPLSGLPLMHLLLEGTAPADLSPLTGLPLANLTAGAWPDGRRRTFPRMPQTLRTVFVSTPCGDLEPFHGIPLEFLGLTGQEFTSLEPFRTALLTNLYLRDTRIRSIAPLVGQPLTQVTLDDNPIDDLHLLPQGCRIVQR